MKMKQWLFIMFTLLSILTSCEMKRELMGDLDRPSSGDNSGMPLENAGMLDLELQPQKEADIPGTKGNVSGSDVVVIDVNEFQVDILDSIGTVVKHYNSYADLKSEGGLLLSAGKYSVKATLGNDVNAGFDCPYYVGTKECNITPQEVAKVITDCVLSNKKIVFRCSDKFLKQFNDDYSIVADNGNGVLTTYKSESRVAYLKSTGVLQFTVYASARGTNKELIYNCDLSKNDDVKDHNNILIDMDIVNDFSPSDPDDTPGGNDGGNEPSDPGDPEEPEEPDTPDNPDTPGSGNIKKPVLKVDVSLIEKNYIIEIPSKNINSTEPGGNGEDNPGGDGDGDNGNSGDNPGGDQPTAKKPTITGAINGKAIDLNQPQMLTSTTKKIVIEMNIPTGLKSLIVDVEVGTIKMPGVDLFDADKVAGINKLLGGNALKPPAKGAKGKQTFDLSPFLKFMEDKNSFHVWVGDNNGETADATITLNKK